MDDYDKSVTLDPCMECGKSCDYARCNVWGVCNGCWQDLMDTDFTPARLATPAKKEMNADDLELMEILPEKD